jgi:hypothetical protein
VRDVGGLATGRVTRDDLEEMMATAAAAGDKEAGTGTGGSGNPRPQTRGLEGCALGKDARPPVLVVGCSDQIPDELRAYHLVSAAEDGGVVLSLHDGVAYTGTMSELSPYCALLSRMVGAVLENLPPAFRDRSRAALVDRWNRAWNVTRLREACAGCDRDRHDDALESLTHS